LEHSASTYSERLVDRERIELEHVAEFEQKQALYEQELSQKAQTLYKLLSRVAIKEEEIVKKEKEKKILEDHLEGLNRDANSFSSQLWEIKHSRAWYIVQFIWKLRLLLFPKGSIQLRLIRFISNSRRSIKNDGIISYLNI
jgi:hypothetical protein